MKTVLRLNFSKGILKKELVQIQKQSSKKEKSHRVKKQQWAVLWVTLKIVSFALQEHLQATAKGKTPADRPCERMNREGLKSAKRLREESRVGGMMVIN